MDDDTLAPFVDALASALIMMVLVSIFFLLQTATSLTQQAKLYTINDKAIEEDRPTFTPVVFRDVLKVDYANNTLVYLLNFKTPEALFNGIRQSLEGHNEIIVTVYSNDSDQKSVVNLLRFLKAIKLPQDISVKTAILPSESAISKIKWETN